MMKEMFLENYVMETDNDAPIVVTVSIGYSEKFELTIRATYTDYEEHDKYGYEIYVRKENSYRLAKRLKTSMINLPDLIAHKVDGYCEVVNADFRVASACFFELRDFLEKHGCHYKVRHYNSRNGGIYIPPVLFRGNNFCI